MIFLKFEVNCFENPRMKKSKLASYSLFAGAFLLGPKSISAQITYTDLDPDIIFDPESSCFPPPITDEYSCSEEMQFILDINSDGDDDFQINAIYSYYAVSSGIYAYKQNVASIRRLDFNRMAGSDTGPEDIVHLFESGAVIGADVVWFGAGFHDDVTLAMYNLKPDLIVVSVGEWLDSEYKFAKLKVDESPNIYYGWVRLSVDEVADQMIIHDYAYNATPGGSILTGETGGCYPPSVSGVSNITATSAKVKWAPVFGATKYQIRFRPTAGGPWTAVSASAAAVQKNLTGLTCNTEYQWQIRTKCGGVFSGLSAMQTFTTGSCRFMSDGGIETSILVFPNPAESTISIDVSSFNGDEIFVQLINILGETVFTENYVGDDLIQIDDSDFPSGNYIVKINSNKNRAIEKIIVQ